jgi:uncharacterized protein
MISLDSIVIETFVPMMQSLSAILDKGAEHARARKLDAAMLVNARLAPDMYTLAQQVRLVSDHAKDAMLRLTGKEPPRFDDNEQTIDESKARLARTIDFLRSERIPASAEKSVIRIPIPDNIALEMNGLEFIRDWAIPHFYFHVVTAYDILRHKGVGIGKCDYLSHVGRYIRQLAP